MLRWSCVILALLIAAVSVAEYLTDRPPLEQLMFVAGRDAKAQQSLNPRAPTVIRLGIASWQMDEFPWNQAIRSYEKAHPDVRIDASVLPEDCLNSMLLFWASDYTRFDAIVAWADEEIHPFIDYNWNTTDPARRSLLINVKDYLTPEQLASFKPALFGGCSRKDPSGRMNIYELPWMGEVLSLNYNKKFFERAGIARPPQTWAEVEDACKKLSGLESGGVKVAALSMNFAKGGFFGQNCYIPMLAAFKKGRGVTDDKGRLDVASPEAIEVFSTLKRWYRAGYLSPNCLVSDSVEQDLRVLRSAMYTHWLSRGLWAIKDHGSDVIGVAPSPGAAEAGSLVATYGCIIPKCSPVIRQTVDFCYETFCTDAHGFQTAVALGWKDPDGRTVGGGKMPATTAMYERPDMKPEIVELGKALDRGYSYPDPVNWGQVADILLVEFQKYLSDASDKLTAEQALANARRRISQEVYKEGSSD
ncbi:MAG: extracellular solute-binding protein [Phycisphaerae bacterium]